MNIKENIDLQIISRYERIVSQEGIRNRIIYEHEDTLPSQFRKYFDYRVELLLRGDEELSPQRLWEEMRKKINLLEGQLAKASEDYTKLENKCRDLQNLVDDLMKGR